MPLCGKNKRGKCAVRETFLNVPSRTAHILSYFLFIIFYLKSTSPPVCRLSYWYSITLW